jgi:hypothetical protein
MRGMAKLTGRDFTLYLLSVTKVSPCCKVAYVLSLFVAEEAIDILNSCASESRSYASLLFLDVAVLLCYALVLGIIVFMRLVHPMIEVSPF